MKFSFSEMLDAMRPSEIRELLKMANTQGLISFGGGMPDPVTFAIDEIRDIIQTILRDSYASALQYGSTSGILPLRTEIKRLVKETENIDCVEDEINVTSGSQQALYAVSKTLVPPRGSIITELPTYVGAISANNANMINMLGVEMDEHGLRMDLLESKLNELKSRGEKPAFIYVIPNFHNPAGYTLTMERRKHLIDIALDFDVPIVEDNPYGELRYSGQKLPSIKSMDPDERVIYMSTFSKVMTPGLRIGYLVGQKDLINKVNLLKQALDLSTNTMSEYIAYEYLKRDVMKTQIPKNIEVYREKRDTMLTAMKETFPEDAIWSKPEGGMFIWATVDPRVNTSTMLRRAVNNGVAYISGVSFYPKREKSNNMRINFSFPTVEQIKIGIGRLAKTLNEEFEEVAGKEAERVS